MTTDSQARREVEINGHNEFWRGTFHGWTWMDGRMMGVIEKESGAVAYVEPHKITFLRDGL